MSGPSPESVRRLVQETLDAVLREKGASDLLDSDPSPGFAPGPAPGAREGGDEEEARRGRLRHEPSDPREGGNQGPQKARLLMLLTGGAGDLAALRLALQTLAEQFFLEIVIAADFAERHGGWDPGLGAGSARIHRAPEAGSVGALLGEAKGLAVAMLARRVAAKVSLGIDDDAASALLLRALERGLPVVAVRGDCDPRTMHAVPSMLQGTGSLRHLLETYMQRLTAWGVRWVEAVETLPAAVMEVLTDGAGTGRSEIGGGATGSGETGGSRVAGAAGAAGAPGGASAFRPAALVPGAAREGSSASARRQFITREDLWKLLERGESEIRVGPRDIVTPEAEDFASSRGIRIVRE